MISLVDVLSGGDHQVVWFSARVKSIDTARHRLVLALGDPASEDTPTVEGAAYLEGYSPRVGDVVQAISRERFGTLVLGRTASK
jgi:hypothetical protein